MCVTDDGNLTTMMARCDASGYPKVNLAVGGLTGTTTPTDNLATPTNAVNSATFLMGYDTSTWDMLRTISVLDNVTSGLLAIGLYGFDSSGGNWDRLHMDTIGSLYVNTGALDRTTDNVGILPASGVTTQNIVTGTSTIVKASAGYLLKVIVGLGVSGATFKIYDDASGSCDTNLKGTYDASAPAVWNFGFNLATGICILTSTTTDITVVYK